MPVPSDPARTGGAASGAADGGRLDRPVLTVTGAVGLLLGSLAWAWTGQFDAAPLVFSASLLTALALAAATEGRAVAAEAAAERANAALDAARGELSRLQAQRPAPGPRRDSELNGLLARRVERLKALTEREGVRVETAFSDLYLAVAADAGRLERAFDRVLERAVLDAPSGGTVAVRSRLVGDRAVAEIEQPGPGLPERELAALFLEADESRGEHAGHAVAGAISVSRPRTGGSRITLSLPFGHRPAVPPTPPPPTPAAPTASRPVPRPATVAAVGSGAPITA